MGKRVDPSANLQCVVFSCVCQHSQLCGTGLHMTQLFSPQLSKLIHLQDTACLDRTEGV